MRDLGFEVPRDSVATPQPAVGRGRGGLKHTPSAPHMARAPVAAQQVQPQLAHVPQRATPNNPTFVVLGSIPTVKKAPVKTTAVPPIGAAVAPVKQLFCHACGTKVPPDANARFCLSCGTKLLQ